MSRFDTSLEHVYAELEWIDLLIRGLVAQIRSGQSDDDAFRGLYLSEAHVNALLATPAGMPTWLAANAGRTAAEFEAIARLRGEIDARRRMSAEAGIELRLDRLRQVFALNDFDVAVLLVCAAGAIDTRYEKLYAYLQDDITKTQPRIELVLNLLEADPRRRIAARTRFEAGAPLMRYRLIETIHDPARPAASMAGTPLKADQRVAAWLLDSNAVDDGIAPFVAFREEGPELQALVLDEQTAHGIAGLCSLRVDEAGASRLVVHLQAREGAGRRTLARAVSGVHGMPLMDVDTHALMSEPDFGAMLVLVDREAKLRGAALHWAKADGLLATENGARLDAFLRAVDHGPPLAFVSTESVRLPTTMAAQTSHVFVHIKPSSSLQRLRLWHGALDRQNVSVAQFDLSALATRFRFTPRQIHAAIRTAQGLALWRDARRARVESQDLYEACRIHSNRTLSTLARKISPRLAWEDIVLPADRLVQLRDLCNHMKYRHQVFSEWGFEHKLATSKGLMALFAGPSGTGKTMAAEIIAGELGLDLYKVDLSSVVSKFIGETEKNLGRIFDEAESANAVLFFDEADALFGRRSEVKDSHDRYANIEVGYLLQRIEEYEGIAILATNFRRNMDEAFVRRLQFTIDFPLPGEADRYRMWQRILPAETPRDSSIDLALLARRFDLSGGSIRNIALAAAFLAADDQDIVRMTHLIAATQREYLKMGKLVAETDFAGIGR